MKTLKIMNLLMEPTLTYNWLVSNFYFQEFKHACQKVLCFENLMVGPILIEGKHI